MNWGTNMNPNDVIYSCLSSEQQLRLLARMLLGDEKATQEIQEATENGLLEPLGPPTPLCLEPEGGWSPAQLAGFRRAFWGWERYPTWIIELMHEEAIPEDFTTACRPFASALDDDLKPAYDFRKHLGFGVWEEDAVLPEELQAPPTPTTVQRVLTHYIYDHKDKEYRLVRELVQDRRVIA